MSAKRPRPPTEVLALVRAFWAELGVPFDPESPAGERTSWPACEPLRRLNDVSHYHRHQVIWRDGERTASYFYYFFCEDCEIWGDCDGECARADVGCELAFGPLPGGGSFVARDVDLSACDFAGAPEALRPGLGATWRACCAEHGGADGEPAPG
jgi:hypothetical protein